MTRKIILTCLLVVVLFLMGCPPKPPKPEGKTVKSWDSGVRILEIQGDPNEITIVLSPPADFSPGDILKYKIALTRDEEIDWHAITPEIVDQPIIRRTFSSDINGNDLIVGEIYNAMIYIEKEDDGADESIPPGKAMPTFGWVDGHTIVKDLNGNLYVGGSFSGLLDFGVTELEAMETDAFLYKYEPSKGMATWALNWGREGFNDQACSLALDETNDCIYVTGYFDGQNVYFHPDDTNPSTANGVMDIFVCRYSLDGELQWKRTFGGQFIWDKGTAIALDNNGDVYVAGVFDSILGLDPNFESQGGTDIFLAKFDHNTGDVIMTDAIGSPENDRVRSIIIDDTGTDEFVYITGTTNTRAFVAQYKTDLSQNWIQILDTLGIWDEGEELAANIANNNIYLVGFYYQMDAAGNPICNFFLAEFQSDGTKTYINPCEAETMVIWDEGEELSVDDNGNVYITGKFKLPEMAPGEVEEMVKLDSNLEIVWETEQCSTLGIWDEGEELIVDGSDAIMVGKCMDEITGMFKGLFISLYELDGDCSEIYNVPAISGE